MSNTEIKTMEPNENQIIQLESFFKSFGNTTRLKILFAIQDQERCVSDLSELTQMPLSALSHQLNLLIKEKLLKRRKEGKQVFYSLDDDHVLQILTVGLSHVMEE